MPYRRTERVEARLADNRQRILRATRQLIADGGFREAQIGSIASAAGLATGTIYRYFPSKADLFAGLLRTICERELAVVREIAHSGGPAWDRLAAAVRAFASRALRSRGLAYAIIVEPVDPEVDKVRLEYRRAQCKVFESILADGVAAEEFPPQDVQASAACLVGAFLEALVSPLGRGSNVDDEDAALLVASIVEFILRAVSGKEPTHDDHRRGDMDHPRGF